MFSKFFSKEEKQDISDDYITLRNLILSLTPDKIDKVLYPEISNVWGTIIDWAFNKIIITVIALADGTTSIYLSPGGSYLNIGSSPIIAEVSRVMLYNAERLFGIMLPTNNYPLPPDGRVRFYVFTYSGAFTAEVNEEDLQENKHDLFPLYRDFHEILARNRFLMEQHESSK